MLIDGVWRAFGNAGLKERRPKKAETIFLTQTNIGGVITFEKWSLRDANDVQESVLPEVMDVSNGQWTEIPIDE